MVVYGVHPVAEALRAQRVTSLLVADRQDARLRRLLDRAARDGVPVQQTERAALDEAAGGGRHQGIVARVTAPPRRTPADLVRATGGVPLLVVLDGVEDPQNVGAILRAVDGAGAHGLVRQTRRSAPLGAAAARASAGALAHVPIADVVNIARAIDELKALGVWTVGLTAEASTPYDAADLTPATALVLGAEGAGLRRLVRERCDRLVSIPMQGHVGSLNVAVAAGIVLFEAARQRRASGPSPADTRPGAVGRDAG